jgi:hypothetical protein
MNIYHVGITVDYHKPWKIKNQFAHSIKNLKESSDKKYYTDNISKYIFKFDIDKGVIVHSGIDEEQDYFTTYHLYVSYKDGETVNVESFNKAVRDFYKEKLYEIIKNCQKTIDKII